MGLIKHPTNWIGEKTIGAAIEVHRHLGPGLLESSYHSCLCHELELRGIRYRSQVPLPLEYKGIQLEKAYLIDLLVEDTLIVETKSVDKLLPIHSAQPHDLHAAQATHIGATDELQCGISAAGDQKKTALRPPIVQSPEQY